MNELIKNSVDARKNAIFSAFSITDDNLKNKINELFNKIEDFAKKFDDLGKFETEFMTSSLNQDYIDLFTMISTNCKANEYQSEEVVSSDDNVIKNELESEAKYLVDDLTYPVRHEAREKFDSTLRDIPVVGDVIQTKQTMDLLNKYKKNSKED